jgi:hypothetical protein
MTPPKPPVVERSRTQMAIQAHFMVVNEFTFARRRVFEQHPDDFMAGKTQHPLEAE